MFVFVHTLTDEIDVLVGAKQHLHEKAKRMRKIKEQTNPISLRKLVLLNIKYGLIFIFEHKINEKNEGF